jgi:hypothetical protein
MVTAILPVMISAPPAPAGIGVSSRTMLDPPTLRHSFTASVDSQQTITPDIYSHGGQDSDHIDPPEGNSQKTEPAAQSSVSRLAGFVGLATGSGALVALALYLPLPAYIVKLGGVDGSEAVVYSFSVVGTIALAVAVASFCGLRGLPGEKGKGWRLLFGRHESNIDQGQHRRTGREPSPYWRLPLDSMGLGFRNRRIGLAYCGGCVARASSVAISLFIPLYVDAYFIRTGSCDESSSRRADTKQGCPAAYILSAELTGTSQLVALLLAPVFGYLSDKYRRHNGPLMAASLAGLVGYAGLARLGSPELTPRNGRRGGPVLTLLYVALIGTSQIGAIVCSLGLLGRGVVGEEEGDGPASRAHDAPTEAEGVPLLRGAPRASASYRHLKGSVAGVYSLSGAAAILLLSKLGGWLFDNGGPSAPFYLMVAFNGSLFAVTLASTLYAKCR